MKIGYPQKRAWGIEIRFRLAVFTAAVCLWLSGCGDGGEKIALEQALRQQEAQSAATSENAPDTGRRDTGAQQETQVRQTSQAMPEKEADTVWVHICGEVEMPGVYELTAGSRICDALLAAGGFTAEADTEFLNLAELVSDGMQIVVPDVEEAWRLRLESGAEENGIKEDKIAKDGRININTASLEMLCTLPGIGESRARDIISYREKHGGFARPEQIMEVSGIKQAVYEKIKDLITVNGG